MIRAGANSTITPTHLSGTLRTSRHPVGGDTRSLAEVEGDHIRRVLEHTGANIQRTAKILGISRSTLYTKLDQLGSAVVHSTGTSGTS